MASKTLKRERERERERERDVNHDASIVERGGVYILVGMRTSSVENGLMDRDPPNPQRNRYPSEENAPQ